jgi:aminoglycoside phosphotransferase family enzyme/predicted kinase
MQGNDQAALIAFLEGPDAYPHRPDKVERIDTHGAVVFLAGSRAYKLKRAVKLSYLDFSTLEKREAVCRREIELNQPAAPTLYKGVVAITREADGAYRVDGAGEPVDWLVEMARFDQDALFDRLAKTGRLDAALTDALADLVVQAHNDAAVFADAAWPESLRAVIGTLGEMLQRWRQISGQDHTGLFEALKAVLDQNTTLLAARRDGGLVRRCHADLHLGNIVLIDGRPCLFDALEFDEELARIDVLYDVAFLVMDVWHRGLRLQAHRLFNRYFSRELSGLEWQGLRAFPLFLAIRAAIRAMVAVDALAIAVDGRRGALMEEIAGYIDLSAELIAPGRPRLIAVGGLSGTGKSTVARAVAPEIGATPGAIILRTDVERKLMRDVPLTERLTADAYSPEARAEVYMRLFAKAKQIVSTGHSVIIDAVLDMPALRDAAKAAADESGVPFVGIWLEAPEEVMIARVRGRAGDASDADAAVVLRQIASTAAPADWHKADAGGEPVQTAANVRRMLRAI